MSSSAIILPTYRIAKLHERAMTMSYENMTKIRAAYNEVIGINEVDHISINIVDPSGKMSIISYNPSIAHTIIQDRSFIYNGSISPDFYENKDIYTWDEAYDPKVKDRIKFKMQIKHCIDIGIVLVKKIGGFHFLYSFAKRNNGSELLDSSIDDRAKYLAMGDHCVCVIKEIYQSYNEQYNLNRLLQYQGLKLVVNNDN